jgi:hypothetical protein
MSTKLYTNLYIKTWWWLEVRRFSLALWIMPDLFSKITKLHTEQIVEETTINFLGKKYRYILQEVKEDD